MRRQRRHRTRSRWRSLARLSLFALLVGIVGAPLLGYALLVEPAALAPAARPLGVDDASRAMALAKRIRRRIASSAGPMRLALTQPELDGLAAVAARSVPGLTTRVEIGGEALKGAASLALPGSIGYLNVDALLEPSLDGVIEGQIRVGRLRFSGAPLLTTLALLGDLALGEDWTGVLLASIQELTLEGERATLVVDASPQLRTALGEAGSRARDVRDELRLIGDPATIGVYFERIVELEASVSQGAASTNQGASPSLAEYLGPLFTLASQRSRGADPALENVALLYAVAVYFGDRRFATLSGLGATSPAALERMRGARVNATLGGRQDLRLHYVISAGLELLSTREMSMAIGEIKELLDTERGGSGFSFSDLAADRAGARFAQMATSSYGGARRVQDALSDIAKESDFFPSIEGLVDGLRREDFERAYGDVDDPRYSQVVDLIDARIEALPAFGR